MKNPFKKISNFYFILITVSVLWYISILILNNYFPNPQDKSSFGNSFGAINSLFSGLALAGIIYTMFLQKRELKLQRKELKQTRNEFKTQNTTLSLQRFENTFFRLLELHHQIVNGIDIDTYKRKPISGLTLASVSKKELEREKITLTGRDVFVNTFTQINNRIKNSDDFKAEYEEYWQIVQTDFGHYFRNFYRIIKLVDETNFLTKKEIKKTNSPESENFKYQYKYTSIARAQLSDYELLWLFYNGLNKRGEKFKPLIEKYSLLKNLPKSKISDQGLIFLYSDQAYRN